MSRISKALDKLRTKCTESGTHPHGKDTASILECIAEHYASGGGGDLPPGGNIGDVLKKTADGAEWATETVGSDLVVNIEFESDYTADKTFEEINEAFPNVKAVFNGNVFNCVGNDGKIYFHKIRISNGKVEEESFIFVEDGDIDYYDEKYPND